MLYSRHSTTPSQLMMTHSMTGVLTVRVVGVSTSEHSLERLTAAACSAICEFNSRVELAIRQPCEALDVVSGTRMVASAQEACVWHTDGGISPGSLCLAHGWWHQPRKLVSGTRMVASAQEACVWHTDGGISLESLCPTTKTVMYHQRAAKLSLHSTPFQRRSTVTSGNFDLATLEEPGTEVTKGRGEIGVGFDEFQAGERTLCLTTSNRKSATDPQQGADVREDVFICVLETFSQSFHRSGNRASFKEEIVECMSKKVHIPIYIDGPFGSSTRDIFDAEHAVLIGGGVGITPYASILQSIMFRYLTMKRMCVKCEHVWYEDMPRELMKVKKVDFIWVNRDQKSFEWFVSLLAQLEMLQTEQGSLGRILDMHLYMTAARSAADLRGLSLQIALETMQSNEHRDTIQGLKTNIQHGRPDWDAIFRGFAAQNVGKVKVFACGPSAMMTAVRQSSQRYHFGFCKEHF
ncbi:hypothetical protein LSAT2_024210 [Lamellibrachia satsuma]|nr:hypothetical protein LSAT2_024210 [Lamellibrachia satsuma]